MAKSKKERRSSIRHMGANDEVLGVLAALEQAERTERESRPVTADDTEVDEAETDD